MDSTKVFNRFKKKTSGETASGDELRRLINASDSKMGEEETSPEAIKRFRMLFMLSQVTGLLPIILTVVWCFKYYGGYGLEDADKLFNYHPTLMIISLVYLSGNSMLVYRFMRFKPKKYLKLLHASIHFLNILFISAGIWAVFDVHQRKNIPHFYSLHSWLGMTVSLAYTMQAIVSFCIFMFPGAKDSIRKYFMPFHVFGGVYSLVLSICVICMGLTEKIIFSDKSAYSGYQLKGLMVNFIGTLLVTHGCLVAWLLYNYEYKRKPLPGESSSMMDPPLAMDDT